MRLPRRMKGILRNDDLDDLDVDGDADFVLGRTLARGRLDDVRWAIDRYGPPRIYEFFRSPPHPELGALATNKLAAIARRGLRRDFWDLYDAYVRR